MFYTQDGFAKYVLWTVWAESSSTWRTKDDAQRHRSLYRRLDTKKHRFVLYLGCVSTSMAWPFQPGKEGMMPFRDRTHEIQTDPVAGDRTR